MSTNPEAVLVQSTTMEGIEVVAPGVLALVQDHVIISTFPEHQVDAAIDLARVLCRALAQSIDVFRLPAESSHRLQTGAIADIGGTEWFHLAHARSTFLKGVNVEIYDRDMSDHAAIHYPAP